MILDLLKISIIGFFAFSFVAQMFPYFNGLDSADYGITAKILAGGSWGISNELLKTSGFWEFVPWTWSKSVENDAVPLGNLGMHGISASAFIVGGEYGLFYLGPLFSILLIIAVDRISVNLFGRFTAFVAVVLTGSSWAIIVYGIQLYSESIFIFFFILGIYFLIKFLQTNNAKNILLGSFLLAIASFFRLNGVISFPLEVFLVVGFLMLPTILKNCPKVIQHKSLHVLLFFQKNNQKNFSKIIFFMLVPWVFFFLINALYNSYYFGDPFLNQYDVRPSSDLEWNMKNALNNLSFDFFRWLSYCLSFLLPDKLLLSLPGIESNTEVNPYDHTWIGIISLLILLSALLVSYFTKYRRLEITIIFLFVLVTAVFYSIAHMSRIPNLDEFTPRSLAVTDPRSSIRYMEPAFPLFFMIFGFVLQKVWSLNPHFSRTTSTRLLEILKVLFLVAVILFLFSSFYESDSLQGLFRYGITSPQNELEKHFPIDSEGLPEKSVIIGFSHYKTQEYGAIHFFPYWGFNFNRIYTNPELIPQEPISTLKHLLSRGESVSGAKSVFDDLPEYEIFVLKDHFAFDQSYYRYLESNHGIILKDYSKSFCKMELVKNLPQNNFTSKGDSICY